MRKKILYIAAMVICLAIITSGTLAYFTAEDTARNVITSGGVEVSVVEQQLVDGALMPYPDRPVPVMPGETVSKIVSVQSAQQPAWVRMAYTVVFYDAEGKEMAVSAEELSKVIAIEPDTTAWTQAGGWWYCHAAVGAGETTAPLFETVSFSGPEMGNKYQNCTVEVLVVAQAVQQANNGDSAAEAVGWPES